MTNDEQIAEAVKFVDAKYGRLDGKHEAHGNLPVDDMNNELMGSQC